MLQPKVIAAVVFVWIVAALIGGLYELSYLDDTDTALINKVLYYRVITTESTIGETELVTGPLDWMESLWSMATFQFSFVTGEMELVRWAVFGPLTAYMVYGIIMTVISILRGTV